MREIRLTGKERTVVRGIGFALGCTGEELIEHCRMDIHDLTDVLNALLEAGFIESAPYKDRVTATEIPGFLFEVNPGYAHSLREAIQRGR